MSILDYLVIGHVTRDTVDGDYTIGGTVLYAAHTARALGRHVGTVTSASPDLDWQEALGADVLVACFPATESTTFENIYTPNGRRQIVHGVAETLTPVMIPAHWKTDIVHVGPVAQECSSALARMFDDAFLGLTPQGWMRCWDETGLVRHCPWDDAAHWLTRADAVVLSEEDIGNDEALVAQYARQTRVLALTQGAAGCTVYAEGQERHFPAPVVDEVDSTGAGDIFAAAFFVSLRRWKDLWMAARFANCIAAKSVTRKGLAGTPCPSEIVACEYELDLIPD